jgi:hypothetical protein
MSQQAVSASSTENSAHGLKNFFQIIGLAETGHNYTSILFENESHYMELIKNKSGRKGKQGPGERYFRKMEGKWPNV